jgi:hypothetical protein
MQTKPGQHQDDSVPNNEWMMNGWQDEDQDEAVNPTWIHIIMLIVTTKIGVWSMMNWGCQTLCHPQLNSAVERAPMIEIISIHLQIYIWLLNPETIAFLHSNQAFPSSCSGNSQGTRKSSWMVILINHPFSWELFIYTTYFFLVKLRLVSYCFTNING